MMKPLAQMTPAEKSRLTKHMQMLVELEGDFPGVLGNKNSFFIAKPAARRRKTVKRAKVAA
ncbi:MAG: hypothetical protein IPK32_02805 [Verrucomicrobiaceae bacterium]|nr:hypothetical protein [Verrucomicrobiaceae bacterium]